MRYRFGIILFLLCLLHNGVANAAAVAQQDLRETTRLAIEAYESSFNSLQFQMESISGTRSNEVIERWLKGDSTLADQAVFYAEDSRGRKAWDMKAFETGGRLVFRVAAYYDGVQGYYVEYGTEDAQHMESVVIDRFWPGDAGQVFLPLPLSLTRWYARRQAWKPYSAILLQEKTKVFGDRLVVEDSSPRRQTTLFPDPSHAYLPSRVTIEFESGGTEDTTVEEFAHVVDRSFPVRGKVQRKNETGGPESNYTNLWKVSSVQINQPIAAEVFKPAITEGVRVSNKITGESVVTGGNEAARSRQNETKADTARGELRASPRYSSTLMILAYIIGTLSLTCLTVIVLNRIRAWASRNEPT